MANSDTKNMRDKKILFLALFVFSSFFIFVRSADAGFFDWLKGNKKSVPLEMSAAVGGKYTPDNPDSFKILYNLNSKTAINKFELAHVGLDDRTKAYILKISSAKSKSNSQPYHFKLNDDYAVVYLGYDNASQMQTASSTVYFKNLGTGFEKKIFYPGYSDSNIRYDSDYAISSPVAVKLKNGSILASFTYFKNSNNNKDPQESIIRVFESVDGGNAWSWISDIKSNPDEYPKWSGIRDSFLAEMKDGSIGLVAVEKTNRTKNKCSDTGYTGYQDDTIVFFKSADGGKTWPTKKRVYVGQCGTDNNQPSLIDLDNQVGVIFHSRDSISYDAGSKKFNKDGDLKMAYSTDGGSNWSNPKLAIKGKYPANLVNPVLYKISNTLVARYNKNYSGSDSGLEEDSGAYSAISNDNGQTWQGEMMISQKIKPSESSSSSSSSNISVSVAPSISNIYQSAVNSFKSVIEGLLADGNYGIVVGTLSDRQGITLPNKAEEELSGNKESFWLNITENKTEIIGASELGALHGLSSLERKMIAGGGKVNPQTVTDKPGLKTRALHIAVKTKKFDTKDTIEDEDASKDDETCDVVTIKDVKGAISKARLYNYNTLILTVTNRIDLDKYKNLGITSKACGGDAPNWTKEEFLDVVKYAQENGLEFIPEIQLLSKANRFFNKAMPNNKGLNLKYNNDTYNPENSEVYSKYVFPIIDELIQSVPNLKAIHIGHDEVKGHSNGDPSMLPAELFLKDVSILNNYIKSKGLETWMWGDMLVSEEEYPEMKKQDKKGGNGLHGSRYLPFNLFSKIPKDIIINDWHYYQPSPNFPTFLAFAQNGHKVLGASWMNKDTINNFSSYAANTQNPNAQGMIATVWARGWKKIDEIISVSGDAFWLGKK